MDRLQPQELEDLVQDLEGDTGAEEFLPPAVEKLLQNLKPGPRPMLRIRAAEQLGQITVSNTQVVRALVTAAETDSVARVRSTAAESLRARVHLRCLQQHPDLLQAVERVVPEVTALVASMAPETWDQDTEEAFEEEQILFEAQDGTTRHVWQPAQLQLRPAAGIITVTGSAVGRPTITVPSSTITRCEIIEREDIPRDTSQKWEGGAAGGSDLGDLFLGLLLTVSLAVFEAIIETVRAKKTTVPVLRLIQSEGDGRDQCWVIDLRSEKRGRRGQAATLKMARRVVAMLCLTGYAGAIPEEPSLPTDLEAFVKGTGVTQDQLTRRAAIGRVLKWSPVAGLIVGLLIGWQHAFHLQSRGCESPDFAVGPLVGLFVGAVVGAGLGAAFERRTNRIAVMIAGGIAAAVVASITALVVRFLVMILVCYW
jgi:hypothetical protein